MPRHRGRVVSAAELLELLRMRERSTPLLVYHSETLPQTPQAEIERAEALGRAVFHVRFVKSDGDARPAFGHLEGSSTV